MKKIISIALCLVFALGCMIIPVSAATLSPEANDIITAMTADNVNIEWGKMGSASEFKAEGEKDTIIAQRSFLVEDGATYPLTVTANITGVKATSIVYVLVRTASGDKKLDAKVVSDGVVTFTLTEAATAISFVKAGIVSITVDADTQKIEVSKETMDEIIADTADGEEVIVPIETAAPVQIPVESIEEIIEKRGSLTVESDIATATLDTKTLETIVANANKDSEIIIKVDENKTKEVNAKQTATIKKLNVSMLIKAEVFVDNEKVSDFKGGKVKVVIPFTPETGSKLSDYVIVYIQDNGKVEVLDTTVVSNGLAVSLEHFSDYAIVKKTVVDSVVDEINKETETETETEKDEEPESPKTGNTSNYAGILMLVAFAVVVGAVSFKKSEQN